uniref:Transforming growth factor beta H HduTGFbH n=1 Tax=Halisarca dujardinii TaxID=2583056 RepID=A0A8F8AR52_HALDU|nr:transforming growth factor beta H HduTGFbH [Halisarca dujardinii]
MAMGKSTLLSLSLILLACSQRFYCLPSGFVHPYLQNLYGKANDEFGRARPGAPAEQGDVWGFLDNGADRRRAAIIPFSPCQQLMRNSLPTAELRGTSREQNSLLQKVTWLFYAKHKAEFHSPSCGQLEVEAVFTLGEQTYRLVQPLSSRTVTPQGSWVSVNVSSVIGGLSAMPEQLVVDTRLRCRLCLPGSALPLELVDVRSLLANSGQYRLQHQPLLALHFKPQEVSVSDLSKQQGEAHRQKRQQKFGRIFLFHVPDGFPDDPVTTTTPSPPTPPPPPPPPTLDPLRCQKHSLSVPVGDLQLPTKGTVVLPTLVHIGRCGGQCLRSYGILSRYPPSLVSHHASIKMTLLAKKDPLSAGLSVSCTPLSYEGVGVIVRSSSYSHKFQHFPGISVKECGCR